MKWLVFMGVIGSLHSEPTVAFVTPTRLHSNRAEEVARCSQHVSPPTVLHCSSSSKSSLFVPLQQQEERAKRPSWIPKEIQEKARRLLKSQRQASLTRRRPLGRLLTSMIKWMIVLSTTFTMKVLNRTYVHDPHKNLQKYAFHRDSDVGLLTISNHCSIIDDPGIWCGSIPMNRLTLDSIRNIIMVEEAYYAFGRVSANVFHGLNCLPIKRGDIRGLESPQLYQLYRRLNGLARYRDDVEKKKEWCHIMIEGRILQPWRYELPQGNTLPQLGKFRLGAAKLIATTPPSNLIVLPIYHHGMHKIFPETPPKDRYKTDASGHVSTTRISGKTKVRFPKWGNRIDIFVGDPITFEDLVPKFGHMFKIPTNKDLLNEINVRLRDSMLELEAKASRNRFPKRRGKGRRSSTQFINL